MGPRLLSRGNTPSLRRPRDAGWPASMGPRLLSRGNADDAAGHAGRRCASMGPRLLSRGNAVSG